MNCASAFDAYSTLLNWANICYKPALPLNVLEFQLPQGDIRHDGKYQRQLVPDIATIVPDHPGDGTGIVRLDHADDPPGGTAQEGRQTGQTDGHTGRGVPRVQVVVSEVAAAEEVVLREEDDEERGVPVAQEGEEVVQHRQQMVSAREAQEKNAGEDEERPDRAGHQLERFCEQLGRNRACIDGDTVHANLRKKKQLVELSQEDFFFPFLMKGWKAYFQTAPATLGGTLKTPPER